MNYNKDEFLLAQVASQLKRYLLRWQQKFALKFGREPAIPDVDGRPKVGTLLTRKHTRLSFLSGH